MALDVLADAALLPPRGVMLEAPFSSLADVGRSLDSWVRALTPLLSSQWESVKAAPKLTAPLLVLHGTRDPLIPIAQGRAVFDAASSVDKEFHAVTGAGHIDVWTVRSQRHLFAWIDQRARRALRTVTHPDAVLRPRLAIRPASR